jgi:hypothetical protein
MRPELLGTITYITLLTLRLIIPIGLTLLVGTLVERYQAAHQA